MKVSELRIGKRYIGKCGFVKELMGICPYTPGSKIQGAKYKIVVDPDRIMEGQCFTEYLTSFARWAVREI